MIPREECDKLLVLAAKAPSGDNAQPWKFVISENAIDIYNIPGKDSSPYNFKERGSFFAHGAVIENITILLSAAGYDAGIALFPDEDNNHIARITITKKNEGRDEPFVDMIALRKTNRTPYKNISLADGHAEALINITKEFGFGELHMIQDQKAIAKLAKILSLSDQLIFEDKAIHDAIFLSIRWTKEDEEAKKGLYIKTLELPPPAQVLFKLMKNWSLLRLLNQINISKFIASQSAKNYAASSAFGVITVPDTKKESFVRAGMLFQGIWLTATKEKLDVQPTTALAYLAQRIRENAPLDLSQVHQEQIIQAEKDIRRMFDINNGTIAMIFRMGYGKTPTAQSQKSIPEIVYS
jgi:hypothetical protein